MKKFVFTSLVTLSILGGALGGTVSYAAENVEKGSNGQVGFTTPTSGALQLLQVADLNFGNHEISAADQIYLSESDTKATVQDLRGTETGWELRVAQVGQFKNGQKELTNAQITLVAPTLDKSSTAIAHVKEGVVLKPTGEAAVIMDAKIGEGNGVATEDFMTGKASLSVPGATVKVKGQYTTTLNWTLTDAVSNN